MGRNRASWLPAGRRNTNWSGTTQPLDTKASRSPRPARKRRCKPDRLRMHREPWRPGDGVPTFDPAEIRDVSLEPPWEGLSAFGEA
jgi:hypothetical protein